MNMSNYFDIKDVYFNELVGDVWLGVFIGIIVISIICIKSKLPYEVTVILNILWLCNVFAAYMGLLIIWIMLVLVIGGLTYFLISKGIRRG